MAPQGGHHEVQILLKRPKLVTFDDEGDDDNCECGVNENFNL